MNLKIRFLMVLSPKGSKMKNDKFKIIGSVALASVGAYVASRGFKDAIELSKMTELNLLAASWTAAELATSTVLFKQSIKNLRQIFNEENVLEIKKKSNKMKN